VGDALTSIYFTVYVALDVLNKFGLNHKQLLITVYQSFLSVDKSGVRALLSNVRHLYLTYAKTICCMRVKIT
jgi:hypothetical protein